MRLPGRRRHPEPAAPLPDGWPGWLPVPGGPTCRDFLPTQRLWDVVRLFHRPDPPGDDAWPSPVMPVAARGSLCDAVGRRVEVAPAIGRPQAAAVLAALGTQDGVSALLGVTGDHALAEARANGWAVVPADRVRPDATVEQVVLVAGLTDDAAADRLASPGLLLLWSDGWAIAGDPWGEEASSVIAGVSGTAERLRRTGLDVLPIGHATPWPPFCHTCNPDADPHAGHAHD